MNEQKNRLPIILLGVFVALCVIIGSAFFIFSGGDEEPVAQDDSTQTSTATPKSAPKTTSSKKNENLVKVVYKDSVLRSTDGGENFETYFKVATTGQIGVADVLSISFHPITKDKVVVTTDNDGLFLNAGRINEWDMINFPPKRIYSFILDKKDPDHKVFASGVVENNGRIFRTVNSGENWKAVYAEPGMGTYISALIQHPKDPLTMLAGTSGGTVIKSFDGGSTWKNVGEKIAGVISNFAFDSTKKTFVYLLSYQQKVYHSSTGGTTWLNWEDEKLNEVKQLQENAAALTRARDNAGAKRLQDQATALQKRNQENKAPAGIVLIVADPIKSGIVYAGTTKGLYRSGDYGKYWSKLNIIESAEALPIRSIAINPKNSNEISFVAGKSFYKTTNNGDSWATAPLDNSRSASFVAYDPFDTKVIFIGMSTK